MKRQFSACQTPRGMYPSIFNSFPVIRTASAKNRSIHVPQPTFLFPLETPLRLSRNMLHGWKDNSMLVQTFAACTHLSSTVSQLFKAKLQKIAVFTYLSPHFFVSPGDAPTTITQYVAWIERQFNACRTPRSMYLSILNSFRVIRCLIQCVTPKIGIFTTFLFPLGTPLQGSTTLNVARMEREIDAYKLSRCMCPSNYNRF